MPVDPLGLQLDVGPGRTVAEFDRVSMTATFSLDRGMAVSDGWRQVSGVAVELGESESNVVSFEAPQVESDEALVFEYGVSDDQGRTARAETVVLVMAARLVPDEFDSIQEAIDASGNGELVLVRPGMYAASRLSLVDRTVRLGSMFVLEQDPTYIASTILDGGERSVLIIGEGADGSRIEGFTFLNANDGIRLSSRVDIHNNVFTSTTDGIDYEDGSGGTCTGNEFRANRDGGVDLNFAVDVVIQGNVFLNNEDDGIEI